MKDVECAVRIARVMQVRKVRARIHKQSKSPSRWAPDVSLEGCDDARPSSTPLGALRLSVDSEGGKMWGCYNAI